MTEEKKKSFSDRIWDLFASVKLAIIIFSIISATSVVGTIIEQQAPPERNLKLLAKMIGPDAAPTVYSVLDVLGFIDMYHSWWFVALLLLFAANLIICSIDRLPRIVKLVREKIRPVPLDFLEKMSIKQTITLKGKPDSGKDAVLSAMKRIGFTASESSESGQVQLYAEKGNYTRLGVYITHLSILIILTGAIIGIFFGFNAGLNLPEGSTSSVAFGDRGTEIPLGFDIRCDNFEVDYYPNTEMPKAYKSWLTVYKNGQEVMKKTIAVNEPLKYEGITFYQSSFGIVPNSMDSGVIVFRASSKDGRSEQFNLRIGERFTIPGTAVQGEVKNFSPALSFDQEGRPFTFADQLVNPAVMVEFTGQGTQKFSGWLLKRYPKTWNLPDGNRVEFLDYWGIEYTGLQVRKDPGVLIVYLGCLIMSSGLYMSFFMSHRRLWVTIAEEKGGSRLSIGASANRNRASFERKIQKLARLLEAGQKGGN